MLAQLVDDARQEGKQVYGLAMHVDYWDGVWQDPYSAPQHSQRQLAYAERFSTSSYTPQLVVNGAVQLVGSNRSGVANALEAMLARPARHAQPTPRSELLSHHQSKGPQTFSRLILPSLIQ